MQGPAGDDYAEARIAELRELIEMMTGFLRRDGTARDPTGW